MLGRVAGAKPAPVMHSLLPAVAWDVHPIWETQGLVEQGSSTGLMGLLTYFSFAKRQQKLNED